MSTVEPVGQTEQVKEGRMTLLAGQLQELEAGLKVSPVPMQLHVVLLIAVVPYCRLAQVTHWAVLPLPVMIIELFAHPHDVVALFQTSFPAQVQAVRFAEVPVI